MDSIEEIIKQVLRCIFDNNKACSNVCIEKNVWKECYLFLQKHAIATVASDIIKYIPEEYTNTKLEWKNKIYSNVSFYTRLVKRQEQILTTFQKKHIPVVVLKGTSVARYYPKPQLRTMGDIDLLVRPEYYKQAVCCLLELGCNETTSKIDEERGRHKSFFYVDVEIELHHFFSSKYMDEDKAEILDSILFDAITENRTVLPDLENGLVLLAHIEQHLKGGLGLRQIIDWFMFVRACLDDEMWYSSFEEKAKLTGLDTLAIIVTRMCQIYLGLTTDITWCKDADEAICNELMQYVLDCGNFGRSREMLQSGSTSKLPSIKHPIQFFKYIQSHGEKNWNALKKHPWLKPFAWIYQSCRYIKLAFQNKVTPNKLKAIYDEGNKRNEMFAALGLK